MLSRVVLASIASIATVSCDTSADTSASAGANLYPTINYCMLPKDSSCGEEVCVKLNLDVDAKADSNADASTRRLISLDFTGGSNVDSSLVGSWGSDFMGRVNVSFPSDAPKPSGTTKRPTFDIFAEASTDNSETTDPCPKGEKQLLLKANTGDLVLRTCSSSAGTNPGEFVEAYVDKTFPDDCEAAVTAESSASTRRLAAAKATTDVEWYSVDWNSSDASTMVVAPALALAALAYTL